MENPSYNKYRNLSDKDIVDIAISNTPSEDNAVAYLLKERYQPLLRKLSMEVYNNLTWHDDCVNDLFVYLKGKDMKWNKLASIEWRGSFSAWLKKTAKNHFCYLKPSLIGKSQNVISIDNDGENAVKIDLPDPGVEEFEKMERRALLIEAISLLPDQDMKFLILKRLQGYNSKEMAILLHKRWQKHNVVKYNKQRGAVIPSAAYIDTRLQRARVALQEIMNQIK